MGVRHERRGRRMRLPRLGRTFLMALGLAGCGPSSIYDLPFEPPRVAEPGAEEIALDLYLVGDAGFPAEGGEPVLRALREMLGRAPERSLVVFLGDNIYPAGLPDSASPTREKSEWILDQQMDAVRSAGARAVFVPGNHDWAHGGYDGWWAVMRQQAYIEEHGGDAIEFLPGYGCPGPAVRDYGEVLRLVVLDTQWWLHPWPKPADSDTHCAADTEEEVEEALRQALSSAGDRTVVVAGHHPIESGGPHGGYFDWSTYLLAPYPVARRLGVGEQDLNSAEYVELRKFLRQVLASNPPLIYAAGHEHSLQVLEGRGARFNLVSGTGIFGHLSDVHATPRTLYKEDNSGFMRVTFGRDGAVRLGVIEVQANADHHEDYSVWLQGPSDDAPEEQGDG